jgi:hypothetical protein
MITVVLLSESDRFSRLVGAFFVLAIVHKQKEILRLFSHDISPWRRIQNVSFVSSRVVSYVYCCFVRRIGSGSHPCSRFRGHNFVVSSDPPTFFLRHDLHSHGIVSQLSRSFRVVSLSYVMITVAMVSASFRFRLVGFVLCCFVDWEQIVLYPTAYFLARPRTNYRLQPTASKRFGIAVIFFVSLV